ncbi:unnamed protein product [Ambrosiozyma monospora]|uniref:Unnamed protein product n=1 Tax=Ambrosiozyma monospora TaxID=43982 RepID=A0A9W6YXE1_AMBMO|nr:unnamed protein product [Ambrosiozyma monospora]
MEVRTMTDTRFVYLGIPVNGVKWPSKLKSSLQKLPPLYMTYHYNFEPICKREFEKFIFTINSKRHHPLYTVLSGHISYSTMTSRDTRTPTVQQFSNKLNIKNEKQISSIG